MAKLINVEVTYSNNHTETYTYAQRTLALDVAARYQREVEQPDTRWSEIVPTRVVIR